MWGYILLALVAAGAYYYYVFLPKQNALPSPITNVGPPQKAPPSGPDISAEPEKGPALPPAKTAAETAADLAAIAAKAMLNTGEFLTSDSSGGKGNKLSNGNFSLQLQDDGNLCLVHNDTGRPNSCTLDVSASGGPFKAILQPDGNFVVYNSGGGAAWASGTQNSSATQVIVNQDGSWQINDSQGGVLFKK